MVHRGTVRELAELLVLVDRCAGQASQIENWQLSGTLCWLKPLFVFKSGVFKSGVFKSG